MGSFMLQKLSLIVSRTEESSILWDWINRASTDQSDNIKKGCAGIQVITF
jgi:hypothetical protein